MKKEIHPDYHPVVFVDSATGDEILTKSTITSDEKRDIDGISHYVVYCDITSFTHPFYTGKQKLVEKRVTAASMKELKKLVGDMYWDYDRMSSSGQETLDKIADILGIE